MFLSNKTYFIWW